MRARAFAGVLSSAESDGSGFVYRAVLSENLHSCCVGSSAVPLVLVWKRHRVRESHSSKNGFFVYFLL